MLSLMLMQINANTNAVLAKKGKLWVKTVGGGEGGGGEDQFWLLGLRRR